MTSLKNQPKRRGGPCGGDVRKPMKFAKPTGKVKVTAKQRRTYDRCHAAMHARAIYTWAIDPKSGLWLVKVQASHDWQELSQQGVDDLLDMLQVPTSTTTQTQEVPMTAAKPTTRKPTTRKATTKKAADAAVSTVVVLPENVQEYLARLVHEPKRIFATEAATAIVSGGTLPTIDAPWAEKVTTKLQKLVAA